MLKIKPIVSLATALLLSGCSTFTASSRSERLTATKTVAKKVLQLVISAYQAGGSELAAAQIDSMAADGKLTETQANALKSMLNGSINTLEHLVKNQDSGKTVSEKETAAASTEL